MSTFKESHATTMISRIGAPPVPFAEEKQLFKTTPSDRTVPGQPMIPLDDASVSEFLRAELLTTRVDAMYTVLRFLSNRNNISALHHQALKGRQILITERSDLHLVWHYDRIFIKPIPLCLLSHAFYATHVVHDPELLLATSGFLRTYVRLIVHESDFEVAKKTSLIPAGDVTWERWCHFIEGFKHLLDSQVSPRYHYGELRLTRLNFYCKLYLEWSYFETTTQYTWYFAKFVAPYLFVFGAISVVLAAMQTALTADPDSVYRNSVHQVSTFCIAITGAGLAFFPLLYIFFQIKELLTFALKHQKAKL